MVAGLLLAVTAGPDVAEGHAQNYCTPSSYAAGSYWCHLHTRYYYFFNGAEEPKSYTVGRDAQINWHQTVYLDLSSTDHASSRMHYDDDTNMPSAYLGLSYAFAHGCTQHAYVNQWQDQNYSSYDWRAVACQEIGHGLGEAHHADDCMGFSYYAQYMDRISSHTRDDINGYYAGHF